MTSTLSNDWTGSVSKREMAASGQASQLDYVVDCEQSKERTMNMKTKDQSAGKCPFNHIAGVGRTNRDWWPNELPSPVALK